MKISNTARQNMIEMVIFKGISIRRTSKLLGIKFSTGKSIIKRYRSNTPINALPNQNGIYPQNIQIRRIGEQQSYLLHHNYNRVKNDHSTIFTD